MSAVPPPPLEVMSARSLFLEGVLEGVPALIVRSITVDMSPWRVRSPRVRCHTIPWRLCML